MISASSSLSFDPNNLFLPRGWQAACTRSLAQVGLEVARLSQHGLYTVQNQDFHFANRLSDRLMDPRPRHRRQCVSLTLSLLSIALRHRIAGVTSITLLLAVISADMSPPAASASTPASASSANFSPPAPNLNPCTS